MSFLAHIGNTLFFLYQKPYNKYWDKALNKLLDEYGESSAVLNRHTIILGNYEVWVSNKWYAYGEAYCKDGRFVPNAWKFRPSIFTMRKLDRLVTSLKKAEKLLQKQKTKEYFS